MNKRILASLVVSGLFFSLKGMGGGESFEDRARSHVDILFSYSPIFEIAMTESEEAFTGNLDEIHAALISRTEMNTAAENGPFLLVLRERIAQQKSATLARAKASGYTEADVSQFLVRIARLERLVQVFATSCEILKRGDYDTPLPINEGLNPALLNPHRKDLVRDSRVSSQESSFASMLRMLAIGGLIIAVPAYVLMWRK